ncbi:MAG: discoidin domain-containing protein, partial [Anaerolineales bacterium]|nr:discoidin domain-containing protein [Anaerolineales bacterium]
LTPGAVNATRRYWRDLLQGLQARQAALEMVFGWQLVNEQWLFQDQPPLSLSEGVVESTTGRYDMSDPAQKQALVADGLVHYIAEVKAEIRQHDPTALVTMGFFAPEIAAPGWYVDTAPLLANADLDFFDFHAYPGDRPLTDYIDAFGMAGYREKPIILGEYGAFRHVYGELSTAARAVGQWQADACGAGFAGLLYWTYYPAGANIGDRTWGFTDEDNYLLELLAPSNLPDPCLAPEIASANLAYQKPVTSSAALTEEPAANAVDENNATQWGSGADAPQWLEVDLGGAHTITEIRLLVGQWPAGDTSHRLLVRSAGGDFVEIHRFTSFTTEGDWLVFVPTEPIPAIQYVRVETLSSPSWVAWKELQVFGHSE